MATRTRWCCTTGRGYKVRFFTLNKYRTDGRKQSGFTIIELLLATAVFSATLLIALNGFLQIGRLFYKGVSNTQTQNATRQVLNEVSRNLQLSPEVTLAESDTPELDDKFYYYCLGDSRYTYVRGEGGRAVKVDQTVPRNYTAAEGNFGLFKDEVNGCESPATEPLSASGVDLLGNKMRLGQLKITNPSPNLYNITVTVIYGDDESLEFPDGLGSPATARCTGSSSSQQFCSVNTLTTSVYKGIQP